MACPAPKVSATVDPLAASLRLVRRGSGPDRTQMDRHGEKQQNW